jgi:hypothetical protein
VTDRIGAGTLVLTVTFAFGTGVPLLIFALAAPDYTSALDRAAGNAGNVAKALGSHDGGSLAACVQSAGQGPAAMDLSTLAVGDRTSRVRTILDPDLARRARKPRPSARRSPPRLAPNPGKPLIPQADREILESPGQLRTTTLHDPQSDTPGRRIPALGSDAAHPDQRAISANPLIPQADGEILESPGPLDFRTVSAHLRSSVPARK